jgi:hypothetical protein
MSTILRLLGFILGEVILLGCLVTNLATIVRYLSSKKRGSTVPLLGGAAGAVGLWVGPMEWMRGYWWLPLVLDPGCAFLIVQLLIFRFRRSGEPPGNGGAKD